MKKANDNSKFEKLIELASSQYIRRENKAFKKSKMGNKNKKNS